MQTALKLTCPGVPDLYQGTELWDLSLVDPDNRRPVDYDLRRQLVLGRDLPVGDAKADPEAVGAPKLDLIRTLLALRRSRPELFDVEAGYEPLGRRGPGRRAGRRLRSSRRLVAGRRLPVPLAGCARPIDDVSPTSSRVGPSPCGSTGRTCWGREVRGVGAQGGALRGGRVVDGARHAMTADERGGWSAEVDGAGAGSRYGFSIDGGDVRPDPRSPSQPDGVDGLSEVVDHGAFAWTDGGWRGVPLPSAVIYELHVGTFTPEGTFDGVIGKLPHLVDLGVDVDRAAAGERVPRRARMGLRRRRPVRPAPRLRRAGGPEAARRRRPRRRRRRRDGRRLQPPRSGRELPRRVRSVLHRQVRDAVGHGGEPRRPRQRRGPPVLPRQRACCGCGTTTATGCASTRSTPSSTRRRSTCSRSWPSRSRRCRRRSAATLFLIAESDLNDPTGRAPAGRSAATAWTRSGATTSTTRSTPCSPASGPATTPTSGHSSSWRRRCGGRSSTPASYAPDRGRRHGRVPSPDIPGWRFLGYLQDHDQVGNRAVGERSSHLLDTDRLKVAAALVLTSPFVPMLFMGEEWGASSPFQYFTDHPDADLGRAVSEGPPTGVLVVRVGARGRARSAGGGDVRAVPARLGRGRTPATTPSCWRGTAT